MSEPESDSNSKCINLGIFFSWFYTWIVRNKLADNSFFHFHDRINTYTSYTNVMRTFCWYFITLKVCINYTIKFFYLSFHVYFIKTGMLWNFMLSVFLILFQNSLYFTNMLSSSIIKDIFYLPLSKFYVCTHLR